VGQKGKVLVVDDNATSRRKMAMAVKRLGHDWVEAAGGEEALALLKDQDFDLILLDIMMPGMDGFEVLEKLRTDRRLSSIPVLVISGMDEDMTSVARAIELGATDFLPKDFNPVLFRARVEACIEKMRLRAAELDYFAQVDRITSAAEVMEERAFHPKDLGLEQVSGRSDAIGRLARVFAEMAQQVYDRERAMMRSIRTAKGVVLLILSGIVGGLTMPISVTLSEAIPQAIGLTFWGDLLPGILCLGIAFLRGKVGRFSRQTMLVLTAWAVLNIGSGIVLFEAAGRVSGIVLSIVLALEGLGVFLIVAMLRMEEASGRRLIGLLLGLAGVVTLALARDGAGETKAWVWVLLAAVVPMLWAITDVLIAAKEQASTLDPLAALGVMYLMSAVLCFPLAVAQDQFFMIHPGMGSTFWLILFNALVDAANYILFVLLIGIAGAVFGSQAAYATTLAGIFWSIILLGEVLSGAAMLALALILVGLLIVGPKSEAADLEVQFVPRSKRKAQKSVFPWSS